MRKDPKKQFYSTLPLTPALSEQRTRARMPNLCLSDGGPAPASAFTTWKKIQTQTVRAGKGQHISSSTVFQVIFMWSSHQPNWLLPANKSSYVLRSSKQRIFQANKSKHFAADGILHNCRKVTFLNRYVVANPQYYQQHFGCFFLIWI